MAAKQSAAQDDPLPAGLARPAVRALTDAGYTRLSQLTRATEAELRALHGMGPNAMAKILAALEGAGLSLAKPSEA